MKTNDGGPAEIEQERFTMNSPTREQVEEAIADVQNSISFRNHGMPADGITRCEANVDKLDCVLTAARQWLEMQEENEKVMKLVIDPEKYILYLRTQLTKEREKTAVLQSQVDNADVNLEQVRLSLKQQLLALEVEKARLRIELNWIHVNCANFAHDATSDCRVCRLLQAVPTPQSLITIKRMAEALQKFPW